MRGLIERIALKFGHGQFQLIDRGDRYDIIGTGAYQGERLGTVSKRWPHRIKKESWKSRKRRRER